jgi:cytochrome c-type biogenesis protein CcsB
MPNTPDMLLFWIALWCYLAGTVAACVYAGVRRSPVRAAAFTLTLAGFTANTVALVLRSIASGHPPVTGLFEYMTLFAWAIVLGFLLIWRRKGLDLVAVFGAVFGAFALAMASLFPARIEQQLIPALQSYWLWIHVSLAVLAEAAFTVAFLSSVMYLIGERRDFRGMPEALKLDTVTYRAIGVGFPLFTIGALFAGAVWAQRAWGSPWSWDPKETSSLIVWFIYAIYLHARFVRGWSGSGVAWLSVLGYAMTIFTILGSKFLGGLHSYGA